MTGLTRSEQIMELSSTVKCKLAPSNIHGIGVFAIRDIKKGEKLYVQPALWTRPTWFTLTLAALEEIPPEVREIIMGRWPQVVNGRYFMSPNFDQRLLAFMNHSDIPNYDEKEDTALRDIKAGEEIFENYKNMLNWEKAFPWLTLR